MTSNGTRGADFERATRLALQRAGYTVIRSAASKSPVDLVALSGERVVEDDDGLGFYGAHVLLIQAKTDGRLDHGEWNDLYDLATGCASVPVLARREREGRRVAVGLHVLTDRKVPRSRIVPMRRLVLPEVTDDE